MSKASDNDPHLPDFIEGVLSVFEGFGGPKEITFRCLNRERSSPCFLCGQPTPNRLETSQDEELLGVVTACRDCLKGAGLAAGNDHD